MKIINIISLSIGFSLNLLISYSIAANTEDHHSKLKSSCGANCVYTILYIADKKVELKKLLSLPIVAEKQPDLSLLDLQKVLDQFGHKMVAVRIQPEHVGKLSHPFIAHVAKPGTGLGHFVVGWATSNKKIEVIDYPRTGRVPLDRFGNYFTGYMLANALENFADNVMDHQQDGCENNQGTSILQMEEPKPTSTISKQSKLTWIGNNEIDLGTLIEADGFNNSHKFSFMNTGNSPLILSDVTSSCACLEARLTTNIIKPGEKGYLFFTIDNNKKGLFTEFVRLRTNVPSSPFEKCIIKGGIVPIVEVAVIPSSCIFENAKKNVLYKKTITLYNPVRHSTQHNLQINNFKTGFPNYVTVRIINNWHMSKDDLFKHIRKCEIEVSIKHNLPPGDYEDNIVIEAEPKDITIPLLITVKPPVDVKPEVCLIRFDTECNVYHKKIVFQAEGNGFCLKKAYANVPWINCVINDPDLKYQQKYAVTVIARNTLNKKVEVKYIKAEIKIEGTINGEIWHYVIPVIGIFP